MSRSSKRRIPRITLTAGFATETAAIAGASWPVASDSCWMTNATKPKPSSAQVCQAPAASPTLTCRSSMTGFAKLADSPKKRPAHTPRTAARSAGADFARNQSRSATTIAAMMTVAMTRSRVFALSTPASGSPTRTNIASPTTTTPAPSTCRGTTC